MLIGVLGVLLTLQASISKTITGTLMCSGKPYAGAEVQLQGEDVTFLTYNLSALTTSDESGKYEVNYDEVMNDGWALITDAIMMASVCYRGPTDSLTVNCLERILIRWERLISPIRRREVKCVMENLLYENKSCLLMLATCSLYIYQRYL
ncbi:unnamed protein product [Nippostrongylus brasiliensis]|uniref:Transthyretin-like family protein n=1 Tax=Nippostrongylus brasiliensis TaxID=27835 RepID=A0A0N4YFT1_NIPBR|nr:unnamed protein product [Nippostrongylus brasiliensis]